MAASYFWPSTLTSKIQKNFSETSGVQIIRTPVDSGVAKQRRRNTRPDTLSVSYILSATELTTLTNFINNDIKGVSRFYWTHPRTQVYVEARILPQQDGQLLAVSHIAGSGASGYYNVQLTIEVLSNL